MSVPRTDPSAAPRTFAVDGWSPSSWRVRPTLQQPEWPDVAVLAAARADLARLPPLVTSFEIESLRAQFAEAAAGQRFILQGGDCAETFDACESGSIAARLKVLLQMSLVLVQGGRRRVTRIGRFAGQYAKPRSADLETRDGVSLPAYRGDIVNGPAFDAAARAPDPRRLVRAPERARCGAPRVRHTRSGAPRLGLWSTSAVAALVVVGFEGPAIDPPLAVLDQEFERVRKLGRHVQTPPPVRVE
jgi:3-deoxy-D-arabino-heptulosonate 7-phosphate (DAHP) synthase class II